MGWFFNSEKRLLFPAYFPFDWKNNNLNYGLIMIYQCIGLICQAFTDCCNDTYVPLSMCLLTYHLKVLSERISSIGTNSNKSLERNYWELREAIKDHKEILVGKLITENR
uniref:Odorant receptor n=1 Tax=Megaselia scalaris TaxID=36166 RepID=T1H198_MEGSC